jgi:hypothetical protein
VNSIAEVVAGVAVFETLLVRPMICMFVKLIAANCSVWPLGQKSGLGGGMSMRLAVTWPVSGRNVASGGLSVVTVFLLAAFGHYPPGFMQTNVIFSLPSPASLKLTTIFVTESVAATFPIRWDSRPRQFQL